MNIKPCPFCGSRGEMREFVSVFGDNKHIIECSNEDCCIYLIADNAGYATKRQAINKWNSRVAEGKE